MDYKHSEAKTDIAGSEDSRQTVVTNWRLGSSPGERRPALHNLGKKSQSESGEVYPTELLTFHKNASKANLYSKEDGSVTEERIKKTAGKSKRMTHSVQEDGDASDQIGGRGLGRSGSPSEVSNSSELQMKQTFSRARLVSSAKSRDECSETSKCFSGKSLEDVVYEEKHSVSALKARFQGQNKITSVPKVEFCCASMKESTSKEEEERRNKGTKHKNEHLDGTDVSGRMDNMSFEDQVNIAGSVNHSEVKRQTVKSNFRFGSSPGERRSDLLNLGNKSQSEPAEDSSPRSVTFHRNGSRRYLSTNGDGSETKERARKTPGKSKKMTHSVQADGEASDQHGARYFRMSEFSSKMNYSSDLQLTQKYPGASLMSPDKSRDECSETSTCFSGKSLEDDVQEEKYSVSELTARFQGHIKITSVPKVDFHSPNMKESKSKGELFKRCRSEKENESRDRWEPEYENTFLETQSRQEKRNKGTKHKNEHLDEARNERDEIRWRLYLYGDSIRFA